MGRRVCGKACLLSTTGFTRASAILKDFVEHGNHQRRVVSSIEKTVEMVRFFIPELTKAGQSQFRRTHCFLTKLLILQEKKGRKGLIIGFIRAGCLSMAQFLVVEE